jgi:hypothetical protein
MNRFGRMQEMGSITGTAERRDQLLTDESRFAHAGNDDAAVAGCNVGAKPVNVAIEPMRLEDVPEPLGEPPSVAGTLKQLGDNEDLPKSIEPLFPDPKAKAPNNASLMACSKTSASECPSWRSSSRSITGDGTQSGRVPIARPTTFSWEIACWYKGRRRSTGA